jgi:hypothetical protein
LGTEQRKHERTAAARLQKGKLYLDSTKRCFQVQAVRDVSPFGIGLVVDGFINNGEKVRLKFAHNNSHIQMYGQVAWSSPMDTDSVSVGNHHFSQLGISLS